MKQDILSLFNQDSHGRLVKTFVLLEYDGHKGVHWCQTLDEETFYFYNCVGMGKVVIAKKGLKPGQVFLETFLPSAGWYQVEGSASYVSARPQRQWKRSLCSATHTVFSPMGQVRISTDYAPFISELAKEQPIYSLDQAATNILNESHLSCKLDNQFAITNKGDIFSSNVQVGKLDFMKRSFKLNPLFKDEFSVLTVGSTFKDKS